MTIKQNQQYSNIATILKPAVFALCSLLFSLSVSPSYAGRWKEYVNVYQYHDLKDGSELIWIGGGEDVINIDVPKGDEDFYEKHINGMMKEGWQPLGGVDGVETEAKLIWCQSMVKE